MSGQTARHTDINCQIFSEPQAQADLNDDENFINRGNVRNDGNVRTDRQTTGVIPYQEHKLKLI